MLNNAQDINSSGEFDDTEIPAKPLTPLELLEERLYNEFEEKQKELEERINKLEAGINNKFGEHNEAIMKHENIRRNHETHLNKIDRQLETMMTISKFNNYTRSQEDIIEELNKTIASNVSNLKQEVYEKYKTTNETINDIKEDINSIRNYIEQRAKEHEQLLLKKTFEEHLESIKTQELILNDKIDAMYSNINRYALLNPSEAPRRDTNITNEPQIFLQYLFDVFSSEVKTIIEKQNKQVDYIQDLMNTLKKNLNTNLYIAAKQALQQLKGRGELEPKVIEDKSPLVSSFLTSLSKKCDSSELQFMNDLKANKIDLDRVKAFSIRTNGYLKHFITLTNQFMLLLTTNVREIKAERIGGLMYIAHQISLLQKSILQQENVLQEYGNEGKKVEKQKIQPAILIRSPIKESSRIVDVLNSSERKRTTRGKNILRLYENNIKEHHKSSSHKVYSTNVQRNKSVNISNSDIGEAKDNDYS